MSNHNHDNNSAAYEVYASDILPTATGSNYNSDNNGSVNTTSSNGSDNNNNCNPAGLSTPSGQVLDDSKDSRHTISSSGRQRAANIGQTTTSTIGNGLSQLAKEYEHSLVEVPPHFIRSALPIKLLLLHLSVSQLLSSYSTLILVLFSGLCNVGRCTMMSIMNVCFDPRVGRRCIV